MYIKWKLKEFLWVHEKLLSLYFLGTTAYTIETTSSLLWVNDCSCNWLTYKKRMTSPKRCKRNVASGIASLFGAQDGTHCTIIYKWGICMLILHLWMLPMIPGRLPAVMLYDDIRTLCPKLHHLPTQSRPLGRVFNTFWLFYMFLIYCRLFYSKQNCFFIE